MSRRGYALTELMVVIAVASVLLGIASGLVALLLGIEQISRESLRRQVTAANLARQFRRDVRSGVRVAEGDSPIFVGRKLGQSPTPDGKPQGSAAWWIETSKGTVIQYRVEGSSLIRALVDHGAVREQEAYQLPEGAHVSLDVSAAQRPALVSLSITTPPGKPIRGAPRVLRVDASLGADREVSP
jgi:prepilin-type N-terminal cleavage/methylation domain-containing protein